MTKHDHSCASNTLEAYATFKGCRIVGVMQDEDSHEYVATWLVFDCGWALVQLSNGSHWVAGPLEVRDKIRQLRLQTELAHVSLQAMKQLAGENTGPKP